MTRLRQFWCWLTTRHAPSLKPGQPVLSGTCRCGKMGWRMRLEFVDEPEI